MNLKLPIITFQSRYLLEEENQITTVIHLLLFQKLMTTDQTTHKLISQKLIYPLFYSKIQHNFQIYLIRLKTLENNLYITDLYWFRDPLDRVATHLCEKDLKHNLHHYKSELKFYFEKLCKSLNTKKRGNIFEQF